ncbi:MAG: DUF4249 domain-containing protein [Phaeodactylibacter sp.]|nr:DUF4249 domain-containing protein [Phaeodactylibacter sp.]
MKINIFFLLTFLFALSSCQDVISLEIENFEEVLVVEGGITHRTNSNDLAQTIKISKTKGFFDQASDAHVEDAEVVVSDGINSYTFTHSGNGAYKGEVPTQPGMTYTLSIAYNGQRYEAQETMVEVPPIDSIYAVFEEESVFSDAGYVVQIDVQDPADQANYYHWKLFKNDEFFIVPDGGNQFNLIASDQFFNGELITGIEPNEEVIVEVGDHIRVEQHGITERYYSFLEQFFELTGGSFGLGDPPPARISGNIQNLSDPDQSMLGYFAVTSVAEATVTLE